MESYYSRHKDKWGQYKAKNAIWRKKNKEHLAEYQREYFSSPEIKKRTAAWRREWAAKNRERDLLNAARRTAKEKCLPFNLELSDIVIPSTCPVLGIELVRVGGKRTSGSPSLDRVVPRLGYVKGNVIVVSWRANRIKADASIEELKLVANFYSSLASKD